MYVWHKPCVVLLNLLSFAFTPWFERKKGRDEKKEQKQSFYVDFSSDSMESEKMLALLISLAIKQNLIEKLTISRFPSNLASNVFSPHRLKLSKCRKKDPDAKWQKI